MASREKRALAPSKSKQKANNDSSSSSSPAAPETSSSSKRINKKSLTYLRSLSNAWDIIETVASDRPLEPTGLQQQPRKRAVIQTALKRKQKARKTLIKAKQKQQQQAAKAGTAALKRIAVDAKRVGLKGRRRAVALADLGDIAEETKYKGTENSILKKLKRSEVIYKDRSLEDHGSADQKISPILGRKLVQISPKGKRGAKAVRKSRNSLVEAVKKEPEVVIKQEIPDSSDEEDYWTSNQKSLRNKKPVHDKLIEVTIEEVIASSSMVLESDVVQVKVEESEGEIKEEKKFVTAKRSLRNGKLRQTSPNIESDSDQKKGSGMSEASVESGLESKPVCLDGETVTVKVEPPANESETVTANNHCISESPELETNNNGCDEAAAAAVAESGPTLRSKTKARNSDSSSESIASDDVKAVNNKTTDSEVVKKERALAKLSEMKSVVPPAVAGNSPKSRRSSLNIDLRRSSLCGDKPPVVGASKAIDDMIDQIKLSIAKTIESKLIFKPEGKASALIGKNFDVKVEEIVAPLSNDSTAKPRLDEDTMEDSTNTSKSRDPSTGLGPSLTKKELAAEDADNSVPRVADTAKEIEKLVMGDIEPPADSQQQPPEDEKPQLAGEGAVADVPIVVVELVDPKKDDEAPWEEKQPATEAESCDDSGEKDCSAKQSESTKKTTPTLNYVKRKSPRSTAAKSAGTSDLKKRLSPQSLSKELDKTDDTEEEVVKTTEEVKSENLSAECNENDDENKTVPATKVLTETAEESSAPEKMEIDESTEASKCEETLESLSREVERLVEAADDDDKTNERKMSESGDNDVSSDVEMRLIIDDEASESVTEESTTEPVSSQPQPQTSDNNEGCDQTSPPEGSSDVQKVDEVVAAAAATAESTSGVQKTAESEQATADSAATTITITTTAVATTKSGTESKTKDAAKASKSPEIEKTDEQKETRRSLRTRGDKQKKAETTKSVPTSAAQDKSDAKTVKSEDAATSEVPLNTTQDDVETADNGNQSQTAENETLPSDIVIKVEPEEHPEPQIRTRRSREVKKQIPIPISTKSKRGPKKHEPKKSDIQQSKEETLLDNEVAKINENTRPSSCLQPNDISLRGVSANASSNAAQPSHETAVNRSKSENDLGSSSLITAENEACDEDAPVKATSVAMSEAGSTDGESSSSTEAQIHETPEDRAKKEAVLRQLGLESWERVKEREAKKGEEARSEPKKEDDAKREQQSSGSLKTVIRLKDKEVKKRSRSPIKMVLKQQGRVDGEESIEFYTIQKEIGSSGVGESSSGANRKLPTNPRHSCDNNEENEDAPLKDRQSLVIPEKSSSFSIHPERLCADNCCYCHGKFGSLDTPMHLAQMKSDERRNKILVIETHLTPDSCLCDACYRHVDRKANSSPTTLQLKPPRQNRQFHAMKCVVLNCFDMARHHVKRRWLVKIKQQIRNQVDMNWETTQHNLVPFCEAHYTKVSRFLTCVLCKRRLTRNSTFPLGLSPSGVEELNTRIQQRCIPASIVSHTFTCRLCKFFIKLTFKGNDSLDNLSENNRDFYKKYRKKLLDFYDIEYESEDEEEVELNQSLKNKDKNRPVGNGNSGKKSKPGPKSSKSPDNYETQSTSASDKSTPEPPRHDVIEPEVTIKEESAAAASNSASSDSRFLSIEGAIEKLKKRKALDTSGPSLLTQTTVTNESNGSARGVVEILMDKEVTLTRLPKKPRLMNNASNNSNSSTPSNDITPVVQRLGANPSISVRTLFPGEEEMNLHANVEFNNIREVTPQGWEKCATIIQYDRDTKLLWQELQRPYGNQSSFLRHLILLEKYYRAGDLILAPHASRNAINYSTSVQNRLISYEGPEKSDEPIMEASNAVEYNNSHRLSGGYVLENRSSHQPGTSASSASTSNYVNVTAQLSKLEPSSRPVKLTPGVSIIKKPPPNLQRLNTSGSGGSAIGGGGGGVNGSAKRKESIPVQKVHGGNTAIIGGKVIQLSEPDYKRFQNLKRQKQMMNERQGPSSPNSGTGSMNSTQTGYKMSPSQAQLQKAQQMLAQQMLAQQQQSQFQKHLRMQQEMLAQRSRGDFEPLICDIRLANENTPTQNLINTLNLPKSIQVTTKTTAAPVQPVLATSTPIPILPKIPKSLTVIPQTVSRLQDK